jgi:hypothetical protein
MSAMISVKVEAQDRSLPAEIRSLTFTIQNSLDDLLKNTTGSIKVVDVHSYSFKFGLASKGKAVCQMITLSDTEYG